MAPVSKVARFKHALKIVGFNLVVLLVLLSFAELAIRHLMTTPAQIPTGPILRAMRTLYWRQRDRDLIQFSRDCSRHDPQLGYTLRPGSCTFSGPEFSNTFNVNSLGLRDDEKSIGAPSVIVLGDSHAMGWGVDQDGTFAQLIERRRGVSVLNAAISSYGTAREFMSLRRLDTSRLRTLVVQYDDNDIGENRAFYQNHNRLATMSAGSYAELTNARRPIDAYYFGKELRFVAGIYVNAVRASLQAASQSEGHTAPPRPSLDEVELFRNILDDSGVRLSGVQIIVFDISNYGRSGHQFFNSLQRSLQYRSSPLDIKPLDSANLLGADHYYRLDGHLNPAGHRTIADAIVAAMTP